MMSLSIIICAVGVLVGMGIWSHYSDLRYARKAVVGKRVVVTGASMGIGAEIAQEYARMGASEIVIAARNVEKLATVKASIASQYPNVSVHVVRADLSNRASSEQLIYDAISLMGEIDYLILNHITNSNYGVWIKDPNQTVAHAAPEFLESMFAVNMFSYVYTATAAFDSLQRSGGAIGIVSSLAGNIVIRFSVG
jgi:short-subunit dehydrogenase